MLISSFTPTSLGGYSGFSPPQQVGVQAKEEESAERTAAASPGRAAAAEKSDSSQGPSSQELSAIVHLQTRDREVRAHEQAHLSAAGGLAVSGASFEYTTGPDGKHYAVGGEVRIDVSKGRTPEETVSKADQIRAAALAPADPSPQDRAVAAAAMQMASEARGELARAQIDPKQDRPAGDMSGMPAATTVRSEGQRSWYAPPSAQNSVGDSGLGARIDLYA